MKVSRSQIEEAASAVRKGDIVIFPTETVYGIGALCSNKKAIRKIYKLKGRSFKKPLSYHLGAKSQLRDVPFQSSKAFRVMVKHFWPGPLTLIVPGKKGGTIGLRLPSDPIAQTLIRLCKKPLLATSVNHSGEPSCVEGKAARAQFGKKVKWVLDSGKTKLAQDSSIVNLAARPYQLIRRGPKAAQIEKKLRQL